MADITNMGDFLKGYKDAKVIDMHNPSCNNCNECCSMGSMLLEDEYKKLKKYLLNDRNGKKIYAEALSRITKGSKGGVIYWMCPFSNSSKKCAIYSIRPSICRDFHCAEGQDRVDKSKYDDNHKTIYDLFRSKYNIAEIIRGNK